MGVSLSHTAVGMMKLLFVFVCSLCCSVIRGQSLCSSPPGYLVIADHFASEVESELAGRNTFVFIEIYYNCVAYGGTDGTKFRQMTITGRYQVDSRIHLGYALYQCINPGAPQWDNLGVILRNGSTINDTTRGCANCQGMTNHTCTRKMSKRACLGEGRGRLLCIHYRVFSILLCTGYVAKHP